MHNVRSRNYYKVGFNFSLEIIRLKVGKFRLNTPIGNWAQAIPAVLSEKLVISTDRAEQESADRPVSLRISTGRQYHTRRPLDQSGTQSDHKRELNYHIRGPVGPSSAPIGPQSYHTGQRKGQIGPVCDVIKQEISSTFRDSESSTTSKFIYVLRLGITPLILKSFISSVQIVNRLHKPSRFDYFVVVLISSQCLFVAPSAPSIRAGTPLRNSLRMKTSSAATPRKFHRRRHQPQKTKKTPLQPSRPPAHLLATTSPGSHLRNAAKYGSKTRGRDWAYRRPSSR
jgi:hypothetical protein